jgi:cation:H+ antiporter
MLPASLIFLVSAALVIIAGSVLSSRADAIADHTGFGRVWLGSVLLAGATSLPELATDVVAVRIGAPNLAAGDLFGSSLANMLILAVIDLLPPPRRVLSQAALENALSACLAIVLNAMATLFVLIRLPWPAFGISPQSAMLLLVYLAGSRALYRNGLRQASTQAQPQRKAHPPRHALRRAIAEFAAAAAVILVVSPALAWSAEQIAVASGLGATFIGTLLLGLCTSLPELITSLAAVRIGALDLAVGNLFGSNAFNMVIFVVLDLAAPRTSIFAALSPVHATSGVLSIILMSLGLAAIMYRAERRLIMIEPDSALMVAAYLLAIWLLYTLSGVK